MKQLFEMARQSKPSILFIDEVDLLCKTADPVRREFLVQTQGVGNNNEGVLVLGATSFPWALDSTIQRCFEQRIYVPLPETEARTFMLTSNLSNIRNKLSDEDVMDVSQRTEGFSGTDIATLVNAALMEPIKRVKRETHFKVVSGPDPYNPDQIRDDLFTPCSPGD